MDDILACYRTLDLEPGVPAESVRRSYVELSQVWDPERYVGNPVLRERAELKRAEIEAAYKAIKAFLPELQNAFEEQPKNERPERDFTELSTGLPVSKSQIFLAIFVIIILLFVFIYAYFLFTQGSHATPIPTAVE